MNARKTLSEILNLTDREISVAMLVREGKTNAGIAADLGVSEKTVKNVLNGPMSFKLGVEKGGSYRVRVALTIERIVVASDDLEALSTPTDESVAFEQMFEK